MKKIYNYSDFNLYERNTFLSWIKDSIIKNLKGWYRDFYTWIKKGLIRKIDSGPNKGKPYAMLFLPENGSIVEQLRNYMSMRHVAYESAIDFEDYKTNEAIQPLTSDKFTNVGSADLKEMIKDYYKVKVHVANYYANPKDKRPADDPARGMKAKPIFIYGAPGIGKTEIVAQCCDDLTIPLLFLDVQFMNPEDFKGVPSVHQIRAPKIVDDVLIDAGSGFTRANPPSVFPRSNGAEKNGDGPGGIIFMDELNRSSQNVLNTMMQFIQQGRIGDEYSLPSKWCLVAAGNRAEDDPDANISDIGTALASRMSIVNFVPNYNAAAGKEDGIGEWKAWADKELGIMPELISYLSAYPERFHENDPQANQGGAFPSPRSWTEASKILYGRLYIQNKKTWRDVSMDFIRSVFEKEIGRTAAASFCSYLEVIKQFSEEELDMILKDSAKVKIPANIAKDSNIFFGLCTLLYNRITETELTPDVFNKVYNLLLYIKNIEDPTKNGKGEKYCMFYRKFLDKFEKSKNTLNHIQTAITPDFKGCVDRRNQLATWAAAYNKKS